jgi:hypothetical protein
MRSNSHGHRKMMHSRINALMLQVLRVLLVLTSTAYYFCYCIILLAFEILFKPPEPEHYFPHSVFSASDERIVLFA